MKFAEDHNSANFKITAYDHDQIGINGLAHTNSLVLSPMELSEEWGPANFSEFAVQHLDEIYAMKPEIILLGTGQKQQFPAAEILRRLAKLFSLQHVLLLEVRLYPKFEMVFQY